MKSCQQGKKPLDNKDYWPHVTYKNVIKLLGSAESLALHKSKFNCCSPVISEYVPEPPLHRELKWSVYVCGLPIHLWVSVDISFSSVQLWVRIRSSRMTFNWVLYLAAALLPVVGSLVVAPKPVVVSPFLNTSKKTFSFLLYRIPSLFSRFFSSSRKKTQKFFFPAFGKNWVKMQLNRG